MTGLVRASTIVFLASLLTGVAPIPVRAQAPAVPSAPVTPGAPTAPVAPVDTLFANASAEEAAVRRVLSQASPSPTVLKAVRTVVADFEAVVRHYPASSFSDDALWRAGQLSKDAFGRFHEARERAAGVRLLTLLASEYPSSRFARQVPDEIAALSAGAPKVAKAGAVPPATPPSEPAPPAPARLATIKAIRRAVLADVVRVVVELDMEIPFHAERLDNPARVFVDLPSTRANMALIDQTLRFDADTDLVRQIRVGRHPNSTTRVVLEAAGVSSYSVYPLYSPYRLVIDCLRERPLQRAAVEPALAPVPLPAPVLLSASSVAALAVVAPPASVPSLATAAVLASSAPHLAAPVVAAPLQPLPARRVAYRVTVPVVSAVSLDAVLDDSRDEALEHAGVAAPKTAATLPATQTIASPSTPMPSGEARQNLAGGLSLARQLGLGVSRIVIDPGHGGHDPGARGRGITEAELVLDIALRLEKLIEKLPGVEVVLTRRENEFITLQERTAIANREGADLFLSIHANASGAASARGVETYFLDFASNQGAAAVAARENATSEQTMGALQDVVKAIALNNKLDESRDFATYVQREMIGTLRKSNSALKDLGVKKAPFVVLIGAAMPSVLAEVSFLTNPQEARLLKGGSYRQRIAQALFEGVKKYQASLKSVGAVAQQQQQQ